MLARAAILQLLDGVSGNSFCSAMVLSCEDVLAMDSKTILPCLYDEYIIGSWYILLFKEVALLN